MTEEEHLAIVGPMREALKELYAVVKGECPSLLNEDSGGDASLDSTIRDAISGQPDWKACVQAELCETLASEWEKLAGFDRFEFAKWLRERAEALRKKS